MKSFNSKNPLNRIKKILKKRKTPRVYTDMYSMSLSEFLKLKKSITMRYNDISFEIGQILRTRQGSFSVSSIKYDVESIRIIMN